MVLNTIAGMEFFRTFQNTCFKHDNREGIFRQVPKKFSMSWILNWGGQEGGINGLRNMVSTMGIRTQGAQSMPIGVFFSQPSIVVAIFAVNAGFL